MQFTSVKEFLASSAAKNLPAGPIGLIFAEDDVALRETIDYHRKRGFASLLVLTDVPLDSETGDADHVILQNTDDQTHDIINRFTDAFAGRWLYYCYNAEFLFYPFCETRSVRELTIFMTEERRSSVFTTVADIYAKNLGMAPNGVDLNTAAIDRTGYYSEGRERNGVYQDHQVNVFGGLKWRYEQHLPTNRRRQDRISLFLAKPGLVMDEEFLFNDEVYNTYSCGWHHNVSAAIASFRTAKYLKSNPSSSYDIPNFISGQSQDFTWKPQQLLDIGLMELGQWF